MTRYDAPEVLFLVAALGCTRPVEGDGGETGGTESAGEDTSAHAEGSDAHAEGSDAHAEGSDAHAEGSDVHGGPSDVHAGGSATGVDSVATGTDSVADGTDSGEWPPEDCRVQRADGAWWTCGGDGDCPEVAGGPPDYRDPTWCDSGFCSRCE